MKKILVILFICCMAVSLFSGCASSLYMRDQAMRENQALAQIPVPEATPKPEKAEKQPDTDQWAREMKSRWMEIENNLSGDKKTTNSLGVSFYYGEYLLKKVVVPAGTYGEDDIGYQREYYYDENGFFFAMLTKGNQNMRFYFKNGWLERWLNEVGEAVDRPNENEDFAEFDSVLFQEADTLLQIFSMDYQNLIGVASGEKTSE